MRTDDELTAESETRERPPGPANPPAQKAPVVKQSYEASADVRRWLLEQALDASSKPPFEPSLLAGRRDRDWILSSLTHFYERDLIDRCLQEVSSGKEATVYAARQSATGVASLAAKVYRPRMFRSLRNDAVYRESRAQYDRTGGRCATRAGTVATRRRRRAGARPRSPPGSVRIRDPRLLYEAGADVPRPLAQSGNAVLMEYIGDDDGPAPLLHEVGLSPAEARPLFDRLMHNIELWLSCDCIHGDLSAYNILYRPGSVTIIDFAQAVDPRHNLSRLPLLERDVERSAATSRATASSPIRARWQARSGCASRVDYSEGMQMNEVRDLAVLGHEVEQELRLLQERLPVWAAAPYLDPVCPPSLPGRRESERLARLARSERQGRHERARERQARERTRPWREQYCFGLRKRVWQERTGRECELVDLRERALLAREEELADWLARREGWLRDLAELDLGVARLVYGASTSR